MATAVAAVFAKAKREIQHHLFSSDAVRPDQAVNFTPSSGAKARQLSKMLSQGIVKKEGADRYWIDVVAYDSDINRRHSLVRTALLTLCAVLAIAVLVLALRA